MEVGDKVIHPAYGKGLVVETYKDDVKVRFQDDLAYGGYAYNFIEGEDLELVESGAFDTYKFVSN